MTEPLKAENHPAWIGKMNNKRKAPAHIAVLYIVCFTVAIYGVQPAYAKGGVNSSTQADLYSHVDDYLQKCVEKANIPVMSVSIVNKNEVLLSGNYGQCKNSDSAVVFAFPLCS